MKTESSKCSFQSTGYRNIDAYLDASWTRNKRDSHRGNLAALKKNMEKTYVQFSPIASLVNFSSWDNCHLDWCEKKAASTGSSVQGEAGLSGIG